MPVPLILAFVLSCCLLACPSVLLAQADMYEEAPIRYSERTPNDILAKRGKEIAAGMAKLKPGLPQLRHLLKELEIPEASQCLVFSKTSLQVAHIHPGNPRAIYFNDDLYVGYVPGGDIELSTVDPELGAVFYLIPSDKIGVDAHPYVRQARCMDCHGGSRTRGWPGFLVRSVYTERSGQPDFSRGSFLSTDASDFRERWGGWYVSGSIGDTKHMGNRILDEGELVPAFKGKLAEQFDKERYPNTDSDALALLLLEHQASVHNALIRANLEFRRAVHMRAGIAKALGEPADGTLRGSALTVAESQVEKVLDVLLFKHEFRFDGDVSGVGAFEKVFLSKRKASKDDRALRDLRMNGRMFTYRCSYMIHSQSFDHLPATLKAMVYDRLLKVLLGEDETRRYTHLRPLERKRILQILVDTRTDLPAAFGEALKAGKPF